MASDRKSSVGHPWNNVYFRKQLSFTDLLVYVPPSHPIFLLFRFHQCRTAAPPFFVPPLYFVTPMPLYYIHIIPKTSEMGCVTLESRTVELCKVVSVSSRNSWSWSCPGKTMPTLPPSPPTSLHPPLYPQQDLPAAIPRAPPARCSCKDTKTLRSLLSRRAGQSTARMTALKEIQRAEIQVGQALDEIPEDSCIRRATSLSNIWDHPCVVTSIEPKVVFCVAVKLENYAHKG